MANAIRPMVLLCGEEGDRDEAEGLWTQARGLHEAAQVPAGIAECDAQLERLAGHEEENPG